MRSCLKPTQFTPGAVLMQLACEHFDANGYAVLPNFLNDEELELLRQECDVIVEQSFEQLVQQGEVDHNWEATQKGCIFETLLAKPSKLEATDQQLYATIRSQRPCDPAVCQLLFGLKIRTLVSALLHTCSSKPEQHLTLFNDQYIVKPPRCRQSGFAWHRDSDWCSPGVVGRRTGTLYLSLWCALDDMTSDNGCLHIWSNYGDSELPQRLQELPSVGQPLPVEAGTVIVMGDRLIHGSLPNSSRQARRAWMPQFSQHPILSLSTDCPVSLAVPLSQQKHT